MFLDVRISAKYVSCGGLTLYFSAPMDFFRHLNFGRQEVLNVQCRWERVVALVVDSTRQNALVGKHVGPPPCC